MSSANMADEIKALKEKIAELEQENSTLKERKNKHQLASTASVHMVSPGVPGTTFADRILENEGLLKNLFLETLDGIVFWGKCGQILAANEATCKIFGLTQAEMLKYKISDFIYQKDEKYSELKLTINPRPVPLSLVV